MSDRLPSRRRVLVQRGPVRLRPARRGPGRAGGRRAGQRAGRRAAARRIRVPDRRRARGRQRDRLQRGIGHPRGRGPARARRGAGRHAAAVHRPPRPAPLAGAAPAARAAARGGGREPGARAWPRRCPWRPSSPTPTSTAPAPRRRSAWSTPLGYLTDPQDLRVKRAVSPVPAVGALPGRRPASRPATC